MDAEIEKISYPHFGHHFGNIILGTLERGGELRPLTDWPST